MQSDNFVRDGEIETTFEDVAEAMAEDSELQKAGSTPAFFKDRVLVHLEEMTIADLVREAVRASDVKEVEMLLEEMKESTQDEDDRS